MIILILTLQPNQRDSISKDDTNEDTFNDQDNDAFEAQSSLPRRRGANKEYIKLTTTKTFDEAEKYLKDNLKDVRRYYTNSNEGKKIYYYCAGNKKCPKWVFILLVIFGFLQAYYISRIQFSI